MAEELQTYLLEHFQWLHRHPELALKEYETTNYVKNSIKTDRRCGAFESGT